MSRCAVGPATGTCNVLDSVLLAREDASLLAQRCRSAVCLADPTDVDGDCLVAAADLCPGWPTNAMQQSLDTNVDGVPDTCQCGDLDADGDVDLSDEVRIDACSAGAVACDLSLADLNRDGQMTPADGAIFGDARDAETLHTLGCTRRLGPAGP